MKKQRTFCPYCGTANLVKSQMLYVEKGGLCVFQCHLCKKVFTDSLIRNQQDDNEQIEDLQTT